jgi:hypothetical protein
MTKEHDKLIFAEFEYLKLPGKNGKFFIYFNVVFCVDNVF